MKNLGHLTFDASDISDEELALDIAIKAGDAFNEANITRAHRLLVLPATLDVDFDKINGFDIIRTLTRDHGDGYCAQGLGAYLTYHIEYGVTIVPEGVRWPSLECIPEDVRWLMERNQGLDGINRMLMKGVRENDAVLAALVPDCTPGGPHDYVRKVKNLTPGFIGSREVNKIIDTVRFLETQAAEWRSLALDYKDLTSKYSEERARMKRDLQKVLDQS